MADIVSVTHATIAIGSAAPASTLEGFEGDSYTVIREVEDLGELGDTVAELIFNPIESGRVRRRKGLVDGGLLELVVGRVGDDPGQLALKAASASNVDRNFKVTLNDAPDEGTATEFYFAAAVMGSRNTLGTADNIIRTRYPLAINTEIFEVAASPGAVTPGEVENLALIVTGTTAIQAWFTPASNAASHQVRYSVADADEWSAPATIVPGGSITGLTPDTAYDVAIRGVNPAGSGEWCTEVEATTDET